MKPMIGLVPLMDYQKESLWMLPGYMDGITEAGGIPLMLPLTQDIGNVRQLARTLDGFLFTGGQDVSPALYGEKTLPQCGELCEPRDQMELLLLQEALRLDKPVLGICRGIQFLNAALGGTLYQDLPTQHPSPEEHRQAPPYHRPSHKVELLPDAPLQTLLQKNRLSVNSCHHQGIKILSPRLLPMAKAPDGLTEGAYLPGKSFVWAVQWHPEFSHSADEDSRKIFRAFVEACETVK